VQALTKLVSLYFLTLKWLLTGLTLAQGLVFDLGLADVSRIALNYVHAASNNRHAVSPRSSR